MSDLQLHGECSIAPFDTPLGEVVAPGDWIGTQAGARYLVLEATLVRATVRRRKDHAQRNRHRLRCARLDRDLDPPEDVKMWWLSWYPRRRR